MQSPLLPVLQQLSPQVPLLLVLIGAIVLAVMNWNRHRVPAVLAFSGAAIQLLIWAIALFLFVMASPSSSQFRIWNIVFVLLRAVGVGLLVAAVFAGREPVNLPGRGFEVDRSGSMPPPVPRFRE